MLTREQLKQKAKEQLKGKVWALFAVLLLASFIPQAFSFIPFIGMFATLLLAPPMALGVAVLFLSVTKGEDVDFNKLFSGFQLFGKTIGLYLLVGVFTFLWSLLLIVPGIIKGYSYSMSFYILAENPDMTPMEALKESIRLTEGYKFELFVLGLSFIGWILLISITFGIASIYVAPYINLTIANFYNNLKQVKQALTFGENPDVQNIAPEV